MEKDFFGNPKEFLVHSNGWRGRLPDRDLEWPTPSH